MRVVFFAALFLSAVSLCVAQQPYKMNTTSLIDTPTTRSLRNVLENKGQNYRGLLSNYFNQWICYWVSQYNALENKGDTDTIMMFDSWLSQNEAAKEPMYEAQQELADAKTDLGSDYAGNIEMYPKTKEEYAKEIAFNTDLMNDVYYRMEREYATFLSQKTSCGSSVNVPSDVSLEEYYSSFGLGRQYQYLAALGARTLLESMLKESSEKKTTDLSSALKDQETKPEDQSKNKLKIALGVAIPIVGIIAIAGAVYGFMAMKKRNAASSGSKRTNLV